MKHQTKRKDPFSSSFKGFGSNMWEEGKTSTAVGSRRKTVPLEMPPGFTKRRRSKTRDPFQTTNGSIFHNSGVRENAKPNAKACQGDQPVPKLSLNLLQCPNRREKPTVRSNETTNRSKVGGKDSRRSTKRSTHSNFSSYRSSASNGVREEVRDLVRQETHELKKILHSSFQSRIHKERNIRLLQAEIDRLKENSRG